MEHSAGDEESPASPEHHPWVWSGLILLLVFHWSFNMWWLAADKHAIRTDEEGHMHRARLYYEALYANPGASLLDRLVDAGNVPIGVPAHPPLMHVTAATAIALFGYSTDVIASVNTLSFVLALLGCFLIALRFLPPAHALFATAVVSLVPIVYVGSRYFMTDYFCMNLGVWAFYVLLRTQWFQRPGWVFCFAVLNGLVILTRTNGFFYYFMPCMFIVFTGLFLALRNLFREPRDWKGLRQWVLHCAVTAVISVGVFIPWYYHNLEAFYHYWTEMNGAGYGGPLVFVEPRNQPDVEAVAPVAAPEAATPATAPSTAPAPAPAPVTPAVDTRPIWERNSLLKSIVQPNLGWNGYPTYIVNNGSFFVICVLVALGLILAPLLPRFRSIDALLVVLWLLGSWFMMTALLRAGTPRYAVPAMPAIGLIAALPVLALPWRKLRVGAGLLLFAVLIFQFGNLSIRSYGTIGGYDLSQVNLPWVWNAKIHRQYNDDSIVLYKDTISLGFSFARLRAPTPDNPRDRMYRAMLQAEQSRPLAIGEDAYYLRLHLRGGEFHDPHFWPGDNPYRRKDIPDALIPKRRIRDLGLGYTPEDLATRLHQADYIVYVNDHKDEEKEQRWIQYFTERGFKLIDRFEDSEYGPVPDRFYGVLARDFSQDLLTIDSNADIDQLDLYSLDTLRRNPDYVKLPEEVRAYAEMRFRALANPNNTEHLLNPAISLVNIDVARTTEENVFEFHFVFKTNQAMDTDWKIFFWGYFSEADAQLLPEDVRHREYLDWNFMPDPPTSTWAPGDYVVLTHRINAVPMLYNFRFGFFRGENEMFGRTDTQVQIDLRQLP